MAGDMEQVSLVHGLLGQLRAVRCPAPCRRTIEVVRKAERLDDLGAVMLEGFLGGTTVDRQAGSGLVRW